MHSTSDSSDGPKGPSSGRRESVRVMVHLDTTIDDGKVARMYQTQNLSGSGMLVRTRRPLPVGTEVSIQFLFPGDPVLSKAELPGGYGFVEGQAVVIRHTHPVKETIRGMALHFVDLENRGRQLLSGFLKFQQGGHGPSTVSA